VILTTDPQTKIPVIVRSSGEPGIKGRGILTGYFGKRMKLEEVLISEKIQPDDLVFTSGEGGWLPDLLVGKVEKTKESQEKVFQSAEVQSLIDPQELRYVFVVKVFKEE
jgi:cell shape-determining protein MreC